jgi:V/A-type H+-transporting ATPase subunit I
MSLRPVSARWFELLTARESLTMAVEALAHTGRVELESHSDTRKRVSLPDLQERMAEYNALARRYHAYWPPGELRPAEVPSMPYRMLDRALARLDNWAEAAEPLVKHLEMLQAEQAELQLLQDMLGVETGGLLDYALLSAAGPSLAVRLFVLPAGYHLASMPAGLLYCRCSSTDNDFLLALGRPEDIETFRLEVAAQKGRVLQLPAWLHGSQEVAIGQVRQRQVRILGEIDALQRRIAALAETFHLAGALADISRLEWFLTNVTELPVSENFAWVTGWTSDRDGEAIRQALDDGGVNAIVRFPPSPSDVQPPMVLQNPWWARPFELFAGMIGTPSGDEADPSRLLAVLVPLMFGYMFGDVGHGLVLLLTGLWLQQRWPLLRILVANGASAMLFGVVFGSVFGHEDIIPALWLHPLDEPMPVMLVPLAGGVLILLLGLLLNAVEAWWRSAFREWLRVEAAVLCLYLSLLVAPFLEFGLVISLLSLLWYLAGSLYGAQTGRLARLGVALGTLLESIIQLLINTISFVRVGAFALAHGGLSLAFVIMAGSTQNVVAGFLIMLLGNVIVILLEGLVVTIQTTRLVLFEFFIRFLRGSGRVFRPLPAPRETVDLRE